MVISGCGGGGEGISGGPARSDDISELLLMESWE